MRAQFRNFGLGLHGRSRIPHDSYGTVQRKEGTHTLSDHRVIIYEVYANNLPPLIHYSVDRLRLPWRARCRLS